MDYSPNQMLRYGKYAGKRLREVPDSYIKWCVKNTGKKSGAKPGPKLAYWAKREFERRGLKDTNLEKKKKVKRRDMSLCHPNGEIDPEKVYMDALKMGIDNGLLDACEAEMFPSMCDPYWYGD